MTWFAHSENSAGHRHLLHEHLCTVARLAEQSAGTAPWAGETRLAGYLHDLGKYAERFLASSQTRNARKSILLSTITNYGYFTIRILGYHVLHARIGGVYAQL